VVFKVLGEGRPTKPANALELGLSDKVWKLLEDCWQTDRTSRPSTEDVLDRVKGAASVCGILSSVGGISQRYEDPDSDFAKFDQLFLGMPLDDEEPGVIPMKRPPSQESILTDTSLPDSLFSKLSEASEAESHITEPPRTSPDVLAWVSCSKGESTDAIPDIFFSPALDHIPHVQITPDPISRPPTPGSETTARPRPFRDNPGPYRNKRFSESSGSSRTMLAGVAPAQREQPRSDTVSTGVPHDRETCPEKSPIVGDLVASPFLLVSDATTIATAQAREDQTRQLRRPPSTLPLHSSKSRPVGGDVSPQIDDRVKQKPRLESPFHFRQRIGKAFAGSVHK